MERGRGIRRFLQATGLVALFLVPFALTGCNAGLLLLLLLLDDKSTGTPTGPGSEPPIIKFQGIENARSDPENAVLQVLLASGNAAATTLRIEFRDLTEENSAFAPITLVPPRPSGVSGPGTLEELATSPDGVAHRIGWNALADFGNDDQRRARLRFTAFTDTEIEADVLIGNDAPRILRAVLSQESGDVVMIDVTLADSASDPVALAVDFSTDTGDTPEFAPATLRDGPSPPLDTSEMGLDHTLTWQAARDVGTVDRPALLRLVPTDLIEGQPGKVGDAVQRTIDLDNNVSPRVDFESEDLIDDPDGRRGVALRIKIRDPERNPVDTIVQWARSGEGFPELPTEPDGNAASREALLADAAERERLQIATLLTDTLDGFVEVTSLDLSDSKNAIPASWLKHAHEARGISPEDNLVGRPVKVTSPDG